MSVISFGRHQNLLLTQGDLNDYLDGVVAKAILEEMNSVLYRQFPVNIFLAACMLEIAPQRDSIRLWNSSMPDILKLTAGKSSQRYRSTMLPLGIMDEMSGAEGEQFVWNGDSKLFVFSDGFIEPQNEQGEMFGYHRIEKLLVAVDNSGDELSTVLKHVQGFGCASEDGDDMTLLEVSG